MKTLITLLLFVTVTLTAQDDEYHYAKLIAADIIDYTGGFIIEKVESGKWLWKEPGAAYGYKVEFPPDYPFESVRIALKEFVDQYNDVTVWIPWTREGEKTPKDNYTFHTFLNLPDRYKAVIVYHPGFNNLLISCLDIFLLL